MASTEQNGLRGRRHLHEEHQSKTFATLDRLNEYTWVKSSCAYYDHAKQNSQRFKMGAEFVEQSSNRLGQTRLVRGVVYYGEPLLTLGDNIACSQLHLAERVAQSGQNMLDDRVIQPVKHTWRNVKAIPSVVLDRVEATLDGYLPEKAKLQTQEAKAGRRQQQSLFIRLWLVISAMLRIVTTRLGFDYDKLMDSMHEIRSAPIYADSINYLRSPRDPEARQRFGETAHRVVWNIRQNAKPYSIYTARLVVQTLIVQPLMKAIAIVYYLMDRVMNKFVLRGPFARDLGKAKDRAPGTPVPAMRSSVAPS